MDKNNNPRHSNGNYRRKIRARFRAMDAPCGICKGRLGPIRYDQQSCSSNPLSFVIDEIKPVSRWREFGYTSPQAACLDFDNLQAAHYICNARKGNRLESERSVKQIAFVSDGRW